MVLVIPFALVSSFLIGYVIDWSAFGIINWTMVVLELVTSGVMFSLTTIIGFFLSQYIKPKDIKKN